MNWLFYTILSAIFVALSNVTRKEGLKKEHALEFATTRSLVATLMVIPFISLVDFSIPSRLIAIMIAIGFLAALGGLFFTKAYRHMDVSSVAPMANINPIFIVLLAVVFLGEKITINHAIGIGLLIIGAYILEMDHNFSSLKAPFVKIWKSKYQHYVIFGLLIYAFTAMLDKLIANRLMSSGHGANAQFTMIFFIWISVSVTFSAMTAIKFKLFREVKHAWHNGWIWIILSAAFVFGATITYYKAITLMFVGIVIPVKRLSSLFETFLGGEIFHEKGLMLKMAACTVMVVGAVIIAI